ncbi:MAG: nitroreductase family protein [Sphaerochaetaceae bacterium]
MDALELLVDRRSIRSFTDKKVERDLMKEIIEAAAFAPTWANFQVVRYNIIEDENIKRRIGEEGYQGFKGNMATLNNAAGVVVLSYVNGKSGHAPSGEVASSKGDAWALFDAGIAAQQFCLVAYAKGVGTVIQGIFDENKIAEIIDLPKNEIVAAVIPYGYEAKHPKAPKRLSVDEISRFI